MQTKMLQVIFWGVILSLTLSIFPYLAQANQPELPPVPCVEGAEPLPLSYGEHTTGCEIGLPVDADHFSFFGSTGDKIRVIVLDTSPLAAVLEIFDPNGTRIINTTSPSVDVPLTVTGTYNVVISDLGFDNTGNYNISAICLLGTCPPPPLQPDVEGIVRLKGEHLVAGRKVILKQPLEANQTTTTDGHGYYKFDNAVPGKTFQVIIKGPVVP